MKSAYELAMARMEKEAPSVKLSAPQLAELRELESQYTAKIAERRLFLEPKIRQAEFEGKEGEADELRAQLTRDVTTLQSDLETRKQKVREKTA